MIRAPPHPALRATFPSRGRLFLRRYCFLPKPLASPRGEAGGVSRLMRWHLLAAVRLWQCKRGECPLFSSRFGYGDDKFGGCLPFPSRFSYGDDKRPTSSGPTGHLPLKGKAFLRRYCFLPKPLASPRGEAGGVSRLMRWHLLAAARLWQRKRGERPLFSSRFGYGGDKFGGCLPFSSRFSYGDDKRPTSSGPAGHLPLEGKAFLRPPLCSRRQRLPPKSPVLTSKSSKLFTIPHFLPGRAGCLYKTLIFFCGFLVI